ncbi:MAG: glucoamylase family protein [Verrucomicrobiota bacterium]|nr:glucoamylase family protein [Verrucomicrobiota bacterium]
MRIHPTVRWLTIAGASILMSAPAGAGGLELTAIGYDRRIDLTWHATPDQPGLTYTVERAATPEEATFQQLSSEPQDYPVYSDYIGENNQGYRYRVKAWDSAQTLVATSPSVTARTVALSDDALLSSVQHATLRYFTHFAHPVSGLAREGLRHHRDIVTSGGSGFGVMAILVGVERGFLTRDQARTQILRMTRFLQDTCTRYHGMWAHWINGETGQTIPFSPKDNGGDIVESSYLMQGLLCARQFFDDATDPRETELRDRITQLWHDMEWTWYLSEPEGGALYWHWSPEFGWEMNHLIRGFNECMITYLLAIASPTHPIPADSYRSGWVHDPERYKSGKDFYGIRQFVGPPLGGPLFFTHYSYLGIDPKRINDPFCNYFENNRNITRIHRAYCIDNPNGFRGYGPGAWGLTASLNPDGYKAHAPTLDDGTIAPTAALSAMPYTPEESLEACRHMYDALGDRIWGPFGFYDAFNLQRAWVSDSYLAIDQGPIVIMIENHRTGMLWRLLEKDPQIAQLLDTFAAPDRGHSLWEVLP